MAKLKKDGTPKMSGGNRENSGRRHKFLGKTKVLQILVPLDEHGNIKRIVNDYLRKLSIS